MKALMWMASILSDIAYMVYVAVRGRDDRPY